MVQNGKFSAAMPALVSALNSVDLPTLGSPTIPHFTAITCLYLIYQLLSIRYATGAWLLPNRP